MKYHWQPTLKQQEALVRTEFEILYGGARGGGKTDAGMAWLLYDIGHPHLRCLVIRRNAKDLNDWLARAREMYKPTGANFVGSEIRFPKGAVFVLGHLADDNAYEQYQGHEYQRMLIEELIQIPTEELYLKLISSCRSTIPELRPQIFATTNPGGRGHSWVKKRFGLSGFTGEIIKITDNVTGRTRVFIPAKVDDNPYITKNDPDYIKFLDGLPDGLRQAWREGSWQDIEIKGVYYSQMLAQANTEGRICDLEYDSSMLVHTVCDLGVGKQLALGFYQKYGRTIGMIDFWEGQEHDGLPQLKKAMTDKPYAYGKHFAPHDINQTEESSGKTRLDSAKELGIDFIKIPKLGINDGIEKGQIVFSRLFVNKIRCEKWLEAMRNYRAEWDEDRLIYKREPVKDWTNHAADVHRYMALIEKQMTGEDINYNEIIRNQKIRQDYGWQHTK